MAAVFGMNPVADVAAIHHQVVGVANAQVDPSHLNRAVEAAHLEAIAGGNITDGVGGGLLRQLQHQLIVNQRAGVEEVERRHNEFFLMHRTSKSRSRLAKSSQWFR